MTWEIELGSPIQRGSFSVALEAAEASGDSSAQLQPLLALASRV